MTMDKMILRGLRCTAHIGCKPEERALPQALLVNVSIDLDTTPAATSDDLAQTVNYAHLSKAILRHCEESTCQLIETLAANLARLVLDFSPLVQAVTIQLQKPAGLPNGDYAAIEITRTRI